MHLSYTVINNSYKRQIDFAAAYVTLGNALRPTATRCFHHFVPQHSDRTSVVQEMHLSYTGINNSYKRQIDFAAACIILENTLGPTATRYFHNFVPQHSNWSPSPQ